MTTNINDRDSYAEFHVCWNCTTSYPIDKVVYFEGDYLCQGCFDEITSTCDECGDRCYTNGMHAYQDNLYCQDCYDEYFAFCRCCDEIHYREDMIDTNDGLVCESCSRYYVECRGCNSMVHEDSSYYDESNDCTYCSDCWRSNARCNGIMDHNYKPNPIFYDVDKGKEGHEVQGVNTRKTLYMGIELEVEQRDPGINLNTVPKKLLEKFGTEKFYMKYDGSLHFGFEVVTHPMTLDYHSKTFPWFSLLGTLARAGFRSHRTTTCGLHVHMNKRFFNRSELIKIGLFVNKNKAIMEKIARRPGQTYGKFKALGEDPNKYSPLYSNYDRYEAVNFTNSRTIELRIFKGTLKPSTFLATLEFSDSLARFVKFANVVQIISSRSFQIYLEWLRVQKGYEYLKKYIISLNLTDQGFFPQKKERKDGN